MPDTYGFTAHGVCTSHDCGTFVTASGSGSPERPDLSVGDDVELRCICGAELAGRVVGLTLDPWGCVNTEDEDEDVDG